MATLTTPGQGDSPDPGDGAQVVSLDAARATHPAPESTPPGDDSPAADVPVLEGEVVRVDQPGTEPGDWLADLATRSRDRRPIVHPALRSRREAAATAKWVVTHYLHVTLYHLTRVPKYASKLAVRAPRGLARLMSGMVRWTFDLEGHPVRVAAVVKADRRHT